MAKTTIHVAAGHAPNSAPGAVYHGRDEASEAVSLVDAAIKLAKPHLAKNHAIKKVPHHLDYRKTVDDFNRDAGSLDLLIEVHFNAFSDHSATGTEVLYGQQATARTLQDALVKVLGLPDRGIKRRNDLYVTTSAVAGGELSGVIVEIAFISNKNDMKVVDKRGAEALATALVSLTHAKYTPLPKPEPTPEPEPEPKPEPKKYWRVFKNDKQVAAYSNEKNAYEGFIEHRAHRINDPNGKDITEALVRKFAPKPEPEPTPEPDPNYGKENNELLKAIKSAVDWLVEQFKKIFK